MSNIILKIIVLCISTLYSVASIAQSSGQNYIISSTMLDNQGNQHLDNIQYFDGMGRLIQTVQKEITPQRKDLVILQEYDYWGRKSES